MAAKIIMLRNLILLIVLSCGFLFHSFGQNDSSQNFQLPYPHGASPPSFGPIVGYRGFGNSFLELGLTNASGGHGIVGFEYSFLNNLKSGDANLSGFSMGYYKGFAFIETGIIGTVYTNFNYSNLYIRPHLGLGIGGIVTLCYGYNFSIGRNHFKEQISPHEFRAIARFPIGLFW